MAPSSGRVEWIRIQHEEGRVSYMAFQFTVNGSAVGMDAPAVTPLLWVIREELKLTGTKFGCGVGLCGACVVHVDGNRAFSCQTQLSERCRQGSDDDRGAFAGFLASRAKSLAGREGAAVRLLSVRPNHERGRSLEAESAPDSR